MVQYKWISEDRKYLICVDSYDDCVLKGRIRNPYQDTESFASLSQFLVKMEDQLEEMQQPQSFSALRKFSEPEKLDTPESYGLQKNGAVATFELKIVFRQHTSWQGVLVWRERNMEHSFRSVLELVFLMHSALHNQERSA